MTDANRKSRMTGPLGYDALNVLVLLAFIWRGASRGAVWQLAVVASVVSCALLAGQAVPKIEGHIPLQAPFRNWAALGVLYLALSLVAFLLARQLRLKMEEKRFEEYDRHWGAILGGVKGAGLCLLVACLAVVLVPAVRPAVRESWSGRVSLKALDLAAPALPSELSTKLRAAFEGDAAPLPELPLGSPLKLPL